MLLSLIPNFFACALLVIKQGAGDIAKLVIYKLALVTLGATILLLSPAKVQAVTVMEKVTKPAYWVQLEHYQARVEYFRGEQDRAEREKTLKKSLLRYVVQKGDTLTKIAAFYRIDVGSILCWNELSNPHLIFPGQSLDILTIEGALHRVCKGDTIDSIAARYKVKPQDVSAFNLLSAPLQLKEGKKLVIPGGTMPPEEKKALQATLIASRYGDRGTLPADIGPCPPFKWPVKGTITSPFGWRDGKFHYGLDIAVPYGSTIRASAPGVVVFNGSKSGYGLVLIINHGQGWSTLYAHNSRLLVEENDKVAVGQPVALIGASGNATGPHLHLEIIYNSRKLDPLHFLLD